MAARKSIVALIAASIGASHAVWTGPFNTDISGIGLGGSKADSLNVCKARCMVTASCQAAQYSATDNYYGNNCFLYNNQNDNQPQLTTFELYKYTASKSTCGVWTGPYKTDIPGTGLGGHKVDSVDHCKDVCTLDPTCQAAQYCATCDYNGLNCFLYDNQNDNQAQLTSFLLFKYSQNAACEGSWAGPVKKDIYGTGLGGTAVGSLEQCKERCIDNPKCQAAQYSATDNYDGNNCFIYDNKNANQPQLKSFDLWYYNRATWTGPFNTDIYGTGMDGGSKVDTLEACKGHCLATAGCKSAQWSATSAYNGNTCFIYDSQNDDRAGLPGFQLYKLDVATWSPPIAADIKGIGIGQSLQANLDACKQVCVDNAKCQTAQYSDTDKWQGNNCFIYDTQTVNAHQFMSFKLYKYDRAGCGTFGCCADNVTPKTSAVDLCLGMCGIFGCCPDGITPKISLTDTCSTGSWTGPFNTDIPGTGFKGTNQLNVEACKGACDADAQCQAIQYSATDAHNGNNCFEFNNQADTGAQYKTFQIYKYARQTTRLFLTGGKVKAAPSAGIITKFAFALALPVAAVFAFVGVKAVRQARSSRDVMPAEE